MNAADAERLWEEACVQARTLEPSEFTLWLCTEGRVAPITRMFHIKAHLAGDVFFGVGTDLRRSFLRSYATSTLPAVRETFSVDNWDSPEVFAAEEMEHEDVLFRIELRAYRFGTDHTPVPRTHVWREAMGAWVPVMRDTKIPEAVQAAADQITLRALDNDLDVSQATYRAAPSVDRIRNLPPVDPTRAVVRQAESMRDWSGSRVCYLRQLLERILAREPDNVELAHRAALAKADWSRRVDENGQRFATRTPKSGGCDADSAA